MCCRNTNLVVKSSENDLELFKKDMTKSKTERFKMIDQETDDDKNKYKRNKDILDKHMRDSSFKLNSSAARIDYSKRIAALSELIDVTDILVLKVLKELIVVIKQLQRHDKGN